MEILRSTLNLRVSFRPERSAVEEPAVVSSFSESVIRRSISARDRSEIRGPDPSIRVTNPVLTSSNTGAHAHV